MSNMFDCSEGGNGLDGENSVDGDITQACARFNRDFNNFTLVESIIPFAVSEKFVKSAEWLLRRIDGTR